MVATKETMEALTSIPTEWLQSLPVPIFILDQKGRIRYCNDTFVELTGYDRGGLIGARLDSLFGQRDISKILEDLLHLYKGQRYSKAEFDLLRQSGTETHVQMDLTPIFGDKDDAQMVTSVFGVVRDFRPVK